MPRNYPQDPDDKEVKEACSFATELPQLFPTEMLANYHSNWEKLVRATAWIMAVRSVLTKRRKPASTLTVERLEAAEVEIWKNAQRRWFPDETDTTTQLPTRQSDLKRLHQSIAVGPNKQCGCHTLTTIDFICII